MKCVCGHVRAHHTIRDSVYAGLMADTITDHGIGWVAQ